MTEARGTARLRSMAVDAALIRCASPAEVLDVFGFLQYDPIRRPARAQDLMLFQRVDGYRAGDLDRYYPGSGLEEDTLHVYGVMRPEVRRLVHPRPLPGKPEGGYRPTGLAADVLAAVREAGAVHPRELARSFESRQAVNAWGGMSAHTTRILEELHYYGLVRVCARSNGGKVYAPTTPAEHALSPQQRLDQLTLRIARLLAPVPAPSLGSALRQLQSKAGRLGDGTRTVTELRRAGLLQAERIDGVEYLWPADLWGGQDPAEPPRSVRFLAPFDPVVWDRRRFELLWEWPYRFEAYTPPARRRFGYYAMPMLWGDTMPGWVNCISAADVVSVQADYAAGKPAGKAFAREFDAEVARLEAMLGTGPAAIRDSSAAAGPRAARRAGTDTG